VCAVGALYSNRLILNVPLSYFVFPTLQKRWIISKVLLIPSSVLLVQTVHLPSAGLTFLLLQESKQRSRLKGNPWFPLRIPSFTGVCWTKKKANAHIRPAIVPLWGEIITNSAYPVPLIRQFLRRATGTFEIVYPANVRCLHIGNKNFVDICPYVDYTMLVQRK
jgi:hypothetical protein